ncbi:pimeloyl-ACP methyl ester carboxylesterase [Geodermatophilus bullaregiensis]|uniref:alpha/beta fold hydrolase n=1 Tax=Geodermatophilus bullaregiensis TaxID=1564160 RepID=UPI0027DDF616|nr:alpha/beta hydrolase [Geodermatophilus bullaregiensis]MBM7805737.1 pimeloyl-ACP methyl ester carboxylesterase [Geodermatophilus bullaregiensis]
MPEASRRRTRRAPAPPTVAPSSTARPSTAPLPSTDPPPPAWPGGELPVRGGAVYVRTTPWAGRAGAPRERALYVHGLGGASTNWTDLAALLAVRCEGWALDLPGFGRSSPLPGGSYSVGGHVRAVVEVLEHVRAQPGEAAGRPVHLLGNSLGGLVTLLVAARRPDLVASLTLVSPAMPVYRVPEAFGRALLLVLLPGVPSLAERRLAGVSPEQSVRGMLQVCFGDPARVPRERLDAAVEEMRERTSQAWANRALVRSMRGLITSYLRVGRANAWRLARALRVPTLVVWGDRDRLVDPRLAPRLAATVPDARLLVLEGVGHVAMLEAPEATARAVLGMLEDTAAEVPVGTPADAAAREDRAG